MDCEMVGLDSHLDNLPNTPPDTSPLGPFSQASKPLQHPAWNQLPLSPISPRTQFSNGRIPTPIHPTFPITPSALHPPSNAIISPNQRSPAALALSHLSPSRAMPSPIREDSMDTEIAGTQLSRLRVTCEEDMDMDEPSFDGYMTTTPTSAPSDTPISNTPPRTGRSRSGAMSAMNRKIFTGFLEDCEKCRNRVPGHYMHFLPA